MPTLTLPARFQRPPFNGDYYRILGLEGGSNPTSGEIKAAYARAALIYHPDKVANPSVRLNPPLTSEEATQCFQAIQEIKSILLSGCAHEFSEDSQDNFRSEGASEAPVRKPKNETIYSADQLSPGEQLKAELYAYVRSARFCDYSEGTGPSVRGYWSYIARGTGDIEQGRSMFTGRMGIATREYHVEVEDWSQPVMVYRKNTVPYTQVTDPDEIRGILGYLSSCIPKDSLNYAAKVYGSHVRDPHYLEASASASSRLMAGAGASTGTVSARIQSSTDEFKSLSDALKAYMIPFQDICIMGEWMKIAPDIEAGIGRSTGLMTLGSPQYSISLNRGELSFYDKSQRKVITDVTTKMYILRCFSEQLGLNHTESTITQSARAELSMFREQNPYVLTLQTLASTWRSTESPTHSQQWRNFLASFNHPDRLEKIEQARIALFDDSVSSRLSPAQVDIILNQLDELEVRTNQPSGRPR